MRRFGMRRPTRFVQIVMEYCGGGSVADIMRLRKKVVRHEFKRGRFWVTPPQRLTFPPGWATGGGWHFADERGADCSNFASHRTGPGLPPRAPQDPPVGLAVGAYGWLAAPEDAPWPWQRHQSRQHSPGRRRARKAGCAWACAPPQRCLRLAGPLTLAWFLALCLCVCACSRFWRGGPAHRQHGKAQHGHWHALLDGTRRCDLDGALCGAPSFRPLIGLLPPLPPAL
jgi:hypothetical protein